MALIPYEHLPAPQDPPIAIAGMPLQEYFCGDARCDCATAHVILGGVPMTVDLGTTRVDFLDEQTTGSREVLRQTLRDALQQGAITRLRDHYAKVREFGRDWHFRYMDWSGLKQGDVVGWEQIFRHLGTPLYTLTTRPPGQSDKDDDGPGEEIRLGLADAYCIEPRCDCQRVVWSVLTAPKGNPNAVRGLGTVEYRFASGQHAVRNAAQGITPNQLYVVVSNLLSARPDFIPEAQQRYAFLREQVTPILQLQRRRRAESHSQPTAGRNDPCPCGSGKKFKRCHGA